MMRFIFALFLFHCTAITYSQSTARDSLRLANNTLDSKIFDRLNLMDYEGFDFMILRVRDSISPSMNACTFMVSKNTCTRMFKLQINGDYTIREVTISDIADVYQNSPCSDKLMRITDEMIELEGYFQDTIPPLLELRKTPFIFYGKVGGKYSIEYFDHDFVSSFHSGLLYNIVCSYFYSECGE